MAQCQCTCQFFFTLVVVFGINHHRKGSGDTLITTSRVAHHRNHGTRHTGITSSRSIRKDVGKGIVAHHQVFVLLAIQGLAQLVSVIALERAFGCFLVQITGFEDEFQLFNRRFHGKIVHLAEGQFDVVIAGFVRGGCLLVQQHFFTASHINEVGMSTTDDSGSLLSFGFADDFDIELFFDSVLQTDVDGLGINQLLAFFYGFRSTVLQHFQLIFALADEGTEGDSDRKTNHTCTRDTYTHGVLQDVGTEQCLNLFRSATQCFCSLGYAECHGDRFCTTNGWNHFTIDESDDLLSF